MCATDRESERDRGRERKDTFGRKCYKKRTEAKKKEAPLLTWNATFLP